MEEILILTLDDLLNVQSNDPAPNNHCIRDRRDGKIFVGIPIGKIKSNS